MFQVIIFRNNSIAARTMPGATSHLYCHSPMCFLLCLKEPSLCFSAQTRVFLFFLPSSPPPGRRVGRAPLPQGTRRLPIQCAGSTRPLYDLIHSLPPCTRHAAQATLHLSDRLRWLCASMLCQHEKKITPTQSESISKCANSLEENKFCVLCYF